MIREKQVRIRTGSEEVSGTISYFSPYLMKKRREAELPGANQQVLLELKSFDIASTLIVHNEVLAEGRGYDHYDSFHCLQSQLEDHDTMILACGNCKYFLFSGMARDMSNGSRGYCLHGRLGQNLRPRDIREIFHLCEEFSFGPKAEREEYRRLWKTSLIERPLSERPRLRAEDSTGRDFRDDGERPASA